MLRYLGSSLAFPGDRRNLFSWGILLAWLAIVTYISLYHEMWRDEVRALSIALSPESVWGLPAALKNEGHPILWYLILRGSFFLIQSPVVLKIASISIAFASVVLFFRFAPFRVWLKILFLFSVLPFYEYSVMARNYGISMLLFFLFALFYSKRNTLPYILALLLAALAHTNIHSAIFTCFLAVYWLVDHYRRDGLPKYRRTALPPLFAFLFVGMGILLAFIAVLPDGDSIVLPDKALSLKVVLAQLWKSALHPGAGFDTIFWGFPLLVRDLTIWIFFCGLLIRPAAAFLFLGGTIALNLFFAIGYSGVLRHQGIFFIFLLTLYWLVDIERGETKEKVQLFLPVYTFVTAVGLPLILIGHIGGAFVKIERDLNHEMSSSQAFGEFISRNTDYRHAILLGEPDLRLESLPYYVDNEIYLARENRFSRYVRLTRDNKQILKLRDLLSTAQSLKDENNRPILIALGHFGIVDQKPPFIRTEHYGKQFTWTASDLRDFQAKTEKIAEFKDDVENERYEIYHLK